MTCLFMTYAQNQVNFNENLMQTKKLISNVSMTFENNLLLVLHIIQIILMRSQQKGSTDQNEQMGRNVQATHYLDNT